MMDKEQIYDRFKGCIYGQAIGDALGLGTEFMTSKDVLRNYPNGLQHYSQIFQDRHRKRWKIGDWTDDTDMMLCIAHAVIEGKGVNLTNIARHFKTWAEGEPMGIGNNTYKVLSIGDYVEKPLEVSRLVWQMSRYKSAANGGLMRTSVVGLFPKAVRTCAEEICKLTHFDPRCVGSCVIVSELIHALVYGEHRPRRFEMSDIAGEYDERIEDYIERSETDNISDLMDDEHMGYTLVTLSVALWAYWHAKSFKDGLLKVVNAGGDADTNAAVACAILGAKFGFSSIPQEYVDGLIYREQLEEVVGNLSSLCLNPKTMDEECERRYTARYAAREKLSNNYKDLKPFVGLMYEFGYWGKDSIPCCLRLQEDLYKRGLLPFMVTSYNDYKKIEQCEPTVKELLKYAWSRIFHREIFGYPISQL